MKKKVWFAAICLMLCFIWGNSLLSGEQSGAVSGGLLEWLQKIFPFLGWLPEFLLRKLGHFSEFGLLGILLTGFFRNQQGPHKLTMPLLCAMLAANIDETIQVVVPNRGPSVVDVWIDVSGACVGIMAVTLLLVFRKKR